MSASFLVVEDLVRRSQFFLTMSLRAVKWGEYSVIRMRGWLSGSWSVVLSGRSISLVWVLVLSKALCKSSNGYPLLLKWYITMALFLMKSVSLVQILLILRSWLYGKLSFMWMGWADW